MLDKLRAMVFSKPEIEENAVDFTDRQLSEAALMFHVMMADGVIVEEERTQLHNILTKDYQLTTQEIDQLIEEAQRADSESIDLYRFTSTLKRELDENQRLDLVRKLWKIVFADGEIHELEDNVVWRMAELLAIDKRHRMELKREVRGDA